MTLLVDTHHEMTHISVMFTVTRTQDFSQWLVSVGDPKAVAAIAARIVRVEMGNFGDSKSVGGKVTELRIDVGQGYRVYLTRAGRTVQLLLCGGDKTTQVADIAKAQNMVDEIEKAAKAQTKKMKEK